MLIATYMMVAPKRLTADFDSGVWTLLYIPFAAGWWLAGLLRTPTVAVLFLAALFWAAMAIAIQGSVLSWDFRMGVAFHLTIWPAPKVSVDVVAAALTALFAAALRQRRLTIVGGGRDA